MEGNERKRKMREIADMTGKRFGKLTVIALDCYIPKSRTTKWLCKCDCGKTKSIYKLNLTHGKSKSCGCASRNKTHGMRHTPIYSVWHNMLRRCYEPNAISYPNYGGKGITVCEEWHKFENFYKDMGDRPDGMSLDRKDSKGNYEPDNCQWATRIEQANNKKVNKFYDINGEMLTVPEIARRNNASKGALYRRLYKGMSIDESLRSVMDEIRREIYTKNSKTAQ